jgi:hypothetical protein
VVSNGYQATAFTCTNTLGTTVTVGVELFGPAGGAALNDASATSLVLAPGETGVFATTPMTAFSVDSNLATFPSKGSARMLVTTSFKLSQGILCSAILADSTNALPIAMTSLPVIRKTTQQGD